MLLTCMTKPIYLQVQYNHLYYYYYIPLFMTEKKIEYVIVWFKSKNIPRIVGEYFANATRCVHSSVL